MKLPVHASDTIAHLEKLDPVSDIFIFYNGIVLSTIADYTDP